MTDKKMLVNGKEYKIIRLLGKGKGGYSYFASDGITQFVLKQIHHEPCDYYNFGNKIQAEINDYNKLKSIGIRMPAMIDVDIQNERILKEFIDGETIYELVLKDKIQPAYLDQIRGMCALLYKADTNIDYFPTNFVVQDGQLYYIDYECNEYMDEWNFENWGVKYWSETDEFLQYAKEHKQQSYALYTFIDAQTAKKYGIKQYTLEPNLFLKRKALENLLNYAFKHCFNIGAEEGYPLKALKGGKGFWKGIYFSIALCVRIVCVTLSACPTGMDVQVPFTVDEELYAEQYFCKNEYEELKKRPYGDDTVFYIKCKKIAYKQKHNLPSGNLKQIDSSGQDVYTLHSEFYPGESTAEKYFFAVTGNAEFIRVDIENILP